MQKRNDLYELIEVRNKQILTMSPIDKKKVADILNDTIEKFKEINRTDFEYEEFAEIFNAMKWNTLILAEKEAAMLIDEKYSSYLSDNCYFQIQLTMKKMQSALGLMII